MAFPGAQDGYGITMLRHPAPRFERPYAALTNLPTYGRHLSPVQMLPSVEIKWAGLVTLVVVEWEWEFFPLPCLKRLSSAAKDHVIRLAMDHDEELLGEDSDDSLVPLRLRHDSEESEEVEEVD